MTDSPTSSNPVDAAHVLIQATLDYLEARGINVQVYQEEGRDLFVVDRCQYSAGELVALAVRVMSDGLEQGLAGG